MTDHDVPRLSELADRATLETLTDRRTFLELQCDVPGEFPFVNHGFGHGQKGAIGILHVEP